MEHFVKFTSGKVTRKSSMGTMIFAHIYSIIESPFKSLMATLTGFVTSFVPSVITTMTGGHMTTIESLLQILVLTASLLIGITSLITWWQKQIDRRRKLKEQENENK